MWILIIAGGGIVAFAEGDLVEVDDINPYAPFLPNVGEMKPIAVPESYTPEEYLKEKEFLRLINS